MLDYSLTSVRLLVKFFPKEEVMAQDSKESYIDKEKYRLERPHFDMFSAGVEIRNFECFSQVYQTQNE